MRSILICALALFCSNAYAKPKKEKVSPPTPTWWCYMGVDENGDMTAACVRDKDDCEKAISSPEYLNKPNCFGQTKAAMFTIYHKRDMALEYDVRPNMTICRAVSKQMAADSEDIIVSECAETP